MSIYPAIDLSADLDGSDWLISLDPAENVEELDADVLDILDQYEAELLAHERHHYHYARQAHLDF